MSLFGISIESKDFLNGCKKRFKKVGEYLSKTEGISRHEVAEQLGGLDDIPIRDDLWTVRQTSLRGGGYNRFHVFNRLETGISLIGMASIRGKEGRNGAMTTIHVAVFVNLDEEEDGQRFALRIQIVSDQGSRNSTRTKSRIMVDGDPVIDWQQCHGRSTQRLFYGGWNEFEPLMRNLEYKKGLDSSSIRLRFEWVDEVHGDDEPRMSCVEATGKGLHEACMRLFGRIDQSVHPLRRQQAAGTTSVPRTQLLIGEPESGSGQ